MASEGNGVGRLRHRDSLWTTTGESRENRNTHTHTHLQESRIFCLRDAVNGWKMSGHEERERSRGSVARGNLCKQKEVGGDLIDY